MDFRIPGGGCSRQVSRGRVAMEGSTGVVCEDSPGEESTRVVCEDSPGGTSPGENLNRCINHMYWIVIIIM